VGWRQADELDRRNGRWASHTKDHYLSTWFHRIARRWGKQNAVLVVAHRVSVMLYGKLRGSRPSSDLGPACFEKLEAT
jgi:hypothetical protein